MNSKKTKAHSRRVGQLVELALDEDLGRPPRDITSQWTIPKTQSGRAVIEAQAPGVLSGTRAVDLVFAQLARQGRARVRVRWRKRDGQAFASGEELCEITGPVRLLLMGERTALNFLACLSGIAGVTREYVNKVRNTGTRICDTRKTLPGFRELAKAAVVHGGGTNHRRGLYDAVLIKNNHADAGAGPGRALRRVLSHRPRLKVQVEVRDRREFLEAVAAGAKSILLDNMTPRQIRAIKRLCPPAIELEASGGVRLDNVAAYARSGVARISIGALTHSVRSVPMHLVLKAR